MAPSRVDVVHIGSACRDIATDDPRGWRMGGGVMYAALTTARLGLATAAIVGVDPVSAAGHELDQLRDAGVDVLSVPLGQGPVYRNDETPTGRVQTCVHRGAPLAIPSIPASWMTAPGWSVVPVAAEIFDDWAVVVPASAHLAVAWQGYLRALVDGRVVTRLAPLASSILRRADLVGVSRQDLAPGTTLDALCRCLRTGADLILTEGAGGGRLVSVGATGPASIDPYRALRSDGEVDSTGAGDTFLAALHATMLHPKGLGLDGTGRPDVRFAAAAGSLVVEDRGLDGVPSLAAVIARRARV